MRNWLPFLKTVNVRVNLFDAASVSAVEFVRQVSVPKCERANPKCEVTQVRVLPCGALCADVAR